MEGITFISGLIFGSVLGLFAVAIRVGFKEINRQDYVTKIALIKTERNTLIERIQKLETLLRIAREESRTLAIDKNQLQIKCDKQEEEISTLKQEIKQGIIAKTVANVRTTNR